MATITIQHGHKNLIFAANVANETGATFEENGNWITISDTPELVIPEYCFRQAFDPDGRRGQRDDPQLASAWRSLLLNKQGYLVHFDDSEILISDTKPQEKDKRPQFLLRFPDQDARDRAEKWASRAGFDSLTAFINEAIAAYCNFWQEKAG